MAATHVRNRLYRSARWQTPLAVAVAVICCVTFIFNSRNCAARLLHAQFPDLLSRSFNQGGPLGRSLPEPSAANTTPSCRNREARHGARTQSMRLADKRILVTGAAGFIGYHTCVALSTEPDIFVLGLDNFNALYSPQLKHLRQKRLHSCCNINVVHGDISNATLLQELFACYKFTQVIHIAAQAGVRQSVAEPERYVHSNVQGTVGLLEAIRRQQWPVTLVYASSSSVYGRQPAPGRGLTCNSVHQALCDGASPSEAGASRRSANRQPAAAHQPVQQHTSAGDGCNTSATGAGAGAGAGAATATAARWGPSCSGSNPGSPGQGGSVNAFNSTAFLTSQGLQPSRECCSECHPTSVYAATKLATESLVAVYTHQYGLKAIGLRFFTVYGPLGRPDMAVMTLNRQLLEGAPITILCFPVSHPHHCHPRTPRVTSSHNQEQQRGQHAVKLGHLAPGSAHPLPPTGTRRLRTHQAKLSSTGLRGWGMSNDTVLMPPDDCIPGFRDFTSVSDVVTAILSACTITSGAAATTATAAAAGTAAVSSSSGTFGAGWHRVFNVGRGQPHSVLEVLEHLQQLHGKHSPVKFVRAAAGAADVWATWADTTTAQQQLGFHARTNLRQGLEGVVYSLQTDVEAAAMYSKHHMHVE